MSHLEELPGSRETVHDVHATGCLQAVRLFGPGKRRATLEALLTREELEEAARELPGADASGLRDFAFRQRACRLSLALLESFYAAHPCRMARVHLLAASAVALGRFWGVSEPFARLGAAVMPVDSLGRPRTPAWAAYVHACEQRLPLEIRDERWIDAHMQDVARARERGYEAAFLDEAARHEGEPLWRLLAQHVEMTLGARLFDHPALAGAVPGESAMAQGLALSLRRLVHAGQRLVSHYAWRTLRALVLPRWGAVRGLVDERRAAWLLVSSFLTAWTAAGVYRRGVKLLHRGQRVGPSDAWPLLAAALGDEVHRVDPRVARFYANPGAWTMRASVTLRSRAARVLARVATWLTGQGLPEHGERAFPGRFRTFRRADGSMHFVRELYCDGALRVFDSDFVVRQGRLYEVFVEHGLELELAVSVLDDGGLRLKGRGLRWHGLPLPWLGAWVEFRILPATDGAWRVDAIGTLRPARPWGHIHYQAWHPTQTAGPG